MGGLRVLWLRGPTGYESLDDEVAEYFWSRRAAGACDAEVLMLMSTLTVCVNVFELDNKRWEGRGM